MRLLLKNCDTVVDIGTDHGLVLKKVFQQSYIKQAIAADSKIKTFISNPKNLACYPVTFCLSDGS
ncbi:SAM-dependent methyltransferase [Areca yellow leaf disease phytoplasma]|uniref:SAM-dependent methyltransferase n=1 Tax=Areca yellow leaf disease phytoplasma TaxID=927614 RepID=UPI0035B53EB0